MNQKNKMIILTGPTAVGKTALSIALAKKIKGEIISADSMQVYRYMDIGSAKILKEEMQGIPHYLVDVLMPEEEFNVCRFKEMAQEALSVIYERGHIPIIVGGTGFYIQALLYDIDFSKEGDHSPVRARLEREAKENEMENLYSQLCKIDPVSAREIHKNNTKRIIRALEFYELNGYPISEHNRREREKDAAYESWYFVLNDDRQHLYQRIDQRVDAMFAQGLVEEVQKLKDMGCKKGMVSMQGLGYKEILAYLDGECSLEDALYKIKRDTRRFAKRQLTWFRRERNIIWIDKPSFKYDDQIILDFMVSKIKDSGL